MRSSPSGSLPASCARQFLGRLVLEMQAVGEGGLAPSAAHRVEHAAVAVAEIDRHRPARPVDEAAAVLRPDIDAFGAVDQRPAQAGQIERGADGRALRSAHLLGSACRTGTLIDRACQDSFRDSGPAHCAVTRSTIASCASRPATHSQLPAWKTSPLPRGKLTIMPLPRLTFSRLASLGLAEQRLGGEAAVLVGEELVLDRDVGAFLDLAGHADGQHLQAVRRAAVCRRVGQAAADLVVEPVDLVAKDMAVGAEQVAIIEAGAGKGPVLGPIDRKAAHAARRAAAPAGIDARASR